MVEVIVGGDTLQGVVSVLSVSMVLLCVGAYEYEY
jgi:hypothetical protein